MYIRMYVCVYVYAHNTNTHKQTYIVVTPTYVCAQSIHFSKNSSSNWKFESTLKMYMLTRVRIAARPLSASRPTTPRVSRPGPQPPPSAGMASVSRPITPRRHLHVEISPRSVTISPRDQQNAREVPSLTPSTRDRGAADHGCASPRERLWSRDHLHSWARDRGRSRAAREFLSSSATMGAAWHPANGHGILRTARSHNQHTSDSEHYSYEHVHENMDTAQEHEHRRANRHFWRDGDSRARTNMYMCREDMRELGEPEAGRYKGLSARLRACSSCMTLDDDYTSGMYMLARFRLTHVTFSSDACHNVWRMSR